MDNPVDNFLYIHVNLYFFAFCTFMQLEKITGNFYRFSQGAHVKFVSLQWVMA